MIERERDRLRPRLVRKKKVKEPRRVFLKEKTTPQKLNFDNWENDVSSPLMGPFHSSNAWFWMIFENTAHALRSNILYIRCHIQILKI